MIKIKKLTSEDNEAKFEIYEAKENVLGKYENYITTLDEALMKELKVAVLGRTDL